MKRFHKICALLCFLAFFAVGLFAATPEEEAKATDMAKNYRLNVSRCPTLEQVAGRQLADVRWSNPGGGDNTFCYVKMTGFQKNHELFAVIFRYNVPADKLEPYSIRKGAKETFRVDEVQKQLIRFYATESQACWQLLKGLK